MADAQQLQDVMAETASHEGVQEGVEAGMQVGQTLQHLARHVKALHLLARHGPVGHLRRLHRQHGVVRQLGRHERHHHGQDDAHCSVLLEASGLQQRGHDDAVAERHDGKRHAEAEDHLQRQKIKTDTKILFYVEINLSDLNL